MTANEEDEAAVSVAKLLWETALLESGFPVDDAKSFSARIYSLAKDTIGMKEELDAVEEETEEAEEEEVAEEEAPVEEGDEYEDPAAEEKPAAVDAAADEEGEKPKEEP